MDRRCRECKLQSPISNVCVHRNTYVYMYMFVHIAYVVVYTQHFSYYLYIYASSKCIRLKGLIKLIKAEVHVEVIANTVKKIM